uniref:Uncharacterized protein n=1 Tax=Onchocerca volvulus TaxID=6282 RepID=A0A8R1XYR8_ONCVO
MKMSARGIGKDNCHFCINLHCTISCNTTFNICDYYFRKFCEGNEKLEGQECGNWSSRVVKDQLRIIIKVDLLVNTQCQPPRSILWRLNEKAE